MLRYVVVPDTDVDSSRLTMAHDIVNWAAPELDLGAPPEILWFADARELGRARVAAAREVFVPGDRVPKAGTVPPFVRYSAGGGWEPAPVIMLNRTQCLPDTPLHELRHLWQIKQGVYRADESSSAELEVDADRWASDALARWNAVHQATTSDAADHEHDQPAARERRRG